MELDNETDPAAIRRFHNSEQLVFKLPFELLSECFLLAMQIPLGYDYMYPLEPFSVLVRASLGHVCADWRAVMNNNPAFWTHITCRFSKWTSILLERRAGLPFTLSSCVGRSYPFKRSYGSLLALGHRNALSGLHLRGENSVTSVCLRDILSGENVPIETLYLENVVPQWDTEEPYRLLEDGLGGDMVHLRSLYLHDFFPPLCLISYRLTRLTIVFDDQFDSPPVPDITELLDVLELASELQYLEIAHWLPSSRDIDEDDRLITWEHQPREIVLRGYLCAIATLLCYITDIDTRKTNVYLYVYVSHARSRSTLSDIYMTLSKCTDPLAVEKLEVDLGSCPSGSIRLKARKLEHAEGGLLHVSFNAVNTRLPKLGVFLLAVNTRRLIEFRLHGRAEGGTAEKLMWRHLLRTSPNLTRIYVDTVPNPLLEVLLEAEDVGAPLWNLGMNCRLTSPAQLVEQLVPCLKNVREKRAIFSCELHLHDTPLTEGEKERLSAIVDHLCVGCMNAVEAMSPYERM